MPDGVRLQSCLRLPVPARLKPGSRIDDFEVLRLVHESRATLLYQVRALSSGQVLALKTLLPVLADDRQSCEGLLAEEWLAKRLVSPFFPQVVPIPPAARHHLYYVMTYHAGATLQQQLDSGKHFPVAESVRIGIQVAKGLGALHRFSVLHRDIKPANLLQAEDGDLRILDMGVALAAGVPYPELQGNPGTPSFMAPELFEGGALPRKLTCTRPASVFTICSPANIRMARSSRSSSRASAIPRPRRVTGPISRSGWKMRCCAPWPATKNSASKPRKRCCSPWSGAKRARFRRHSAPLCGTAIRPRAGRRSRWSC